MRKTFLLIWFILCFASVYSQTTSDQTDSIDTKINDSKILASSNPAEATQKLLELKSHSEKIQYKYGVMQSAMGLVLLYYNDGNYKKTIEESQVVEQYAKELNDNIYLSDTYRMKANAYGEMGLVKECLEELQKALPVIDKIKDPGRRYYRKALIYETYSSSYDKVGDTDKQIFYRHKSIEESMHIPETKPLIINAKYQNLAYQYASLGLVYSNLKVNDSANYYFEKALKITESKDYEIYTNVKATLYSDMARFYDLNGQHQKSILFAKRAEILEKQAPMPYIRRDIYQSLFNSYVETHKQDSSKYYLKLYTSLNDSLIKSEKEGMMTPVKQIISDNETENKNTVKNILIISAITFIILILIGWIYLRRKNNVIYKKYEELIAKVNADKEYENSLPENQTEQIIDHTATKHTVQITDETTRMLLQKLEKFERSDKFLRKDISLTWLANHLNTNTKYLSEIIKNHKDKSFNNFINGLRIDYVTRKLVEDPVYREYKISYLADECGYASRQVFVISFKKETGLTPSYFIENLKNDASMNKVI